MDHYKLSELLRKSIKGKCKEDVRKTFKTNYGESQYVIILNSEKKNMIKENGSIILKLFLIKIRF